MLQSRKLVRAAVYLKCHQLAVNQVEVPGQAQAWCKQPDRSAQVALSPGSPLRCIHTSRKQLKLHKIIKNTSDLTRFLTEVGTDPKEARYWLKNFVARSDETEIFMVVNLQNDVFQSHALLEKFASAISFLHRNGISPLIILGNKLSKQNFKTVKDLSIWNAIKLSEMVEENGSQTRVMYPGSGVVIGNDPATGESGCNFTIHTDHIYRSLTTKRLPIMLSYGETPQGQIFAVNQWDLTVQMSRIFQPKKVMLVNSEGGLPDEQGKVIANINLPSDLKLLKQKPWASAQIEGIMTEVNRLLNDLSSESSVVISSADTMLRELFSHGGSGTFFRSTEVIHRYTSLKGIDLDRLRVLLNRSFMVEVGDHYFEDIADQIHAIYLSEIYSGVAIVLRSEEQGVPYLCKFAVTSKAQGQGTGELLWDALVTSEPCLYWRSKTANPINTWYFRKCEGSWHNPVWTVFWYGIQDPNKSSGLITDAISRKHSFKPGAIANIVSDDEEERIGG